MVGGESQKKKHIIIAKFSSVITTSVICILLLALLFIPMISGDAVSGNVVAAGPFNYSHVLVILALLAAVILLLNTSKFFSSLEHVNNNAKQLASGELNISDIRLDQARGLEVLARAFNDMKSNLLSFIELTKGNVIVLSDAIDKVSRSIEMSYKGNENIADNINHVAEKAQEQLKIVNRTIEGIEDISQRVDAIITNISNIENYVEENARITRSGTEHMDQFYAQINTISDNLNNTYEFFEKLNTEIKEITEVSEFIIRISEQLKLLGINASVEASKAGEYSKGFTVVANEINQLAAKTKDGIARIQSIVESIIKNSGFVSESISSCVASFNNSKETFNTVKEFFHTINSQSALLNNGMRDIYTQINQINNFTKETNTMGEALHSASIEISQKTQEIAAVTKEELAELEKIKQNTLQLNQMLTTIQNLTRKFRTAIVPVAKTSPKKLKIAFMSPLDHTFWVSVRQGVLYAQKELEDKNVHVEYRGFPAGYTAKEFVEALNNYIEQGYDAFAAPGFFVETFPIFNRLAARGIPVISFNHDFPKDVKRLAYYGPDNYQQGVEAARLMARALNGKGNILVARRDSGIETGIHELRTKGFVEQLKSFRKIKIIGYVNVEDTYDTVYKQVKNFLDNNRNVDGIFVAGGGPTGAAQAIVEAGLKGRTKVVCFDHDKDIFKAIRDGIIYAAIGQDPFGQGHDPIIYLYNYLVAGEKPPSDHIPTRFDVVDYHNVDDLMEA
ncbi:MAG TPA: substrate-binding domain-containing protein [Thermoclostridium caenicola]|nr:substrate-binding domain-containing protein [Thermoclostridium caenicola]